MSDELTRLRGKAEGLLAADSSRDDLEMLLDKLASLAPRESNDALFAHRHLAELRIERHPWRAAMHIRHALHVAPDDDLLHGLSGLCHALLDNYRCAASSYKRALSLAPRNPWYHHNLGHLLDVAMGDAKGALPHLRAAHVLEPLEDEITASLAHCLATLGELDEASALASDALAASPHNGDHKALLAWIENGAKKDDGPHAHRGGRNSSPPMGDRETRRRIHRHDDVVTLLDARMREAGFSDAQRERARAIWSDFVSAHPQRVMKPEVAAAAVEYAIVFVHSLRGVTRAQVAKRYGVSLNALVSRYSQIREALRLDVRDPRYEATS